MVFPTLYSCLNTELDKRLINRAKRFSRVSRLRTSQHHGQYCCTAQYFERVSKTCKPVDVTNTTYILPHLGGEESESLLSLLLRALLRPSQLLLHYEQDPGQGLFRRIDVKEGQPRPPGQHVHDRTSILIHGVFYLETG